MTDEELRGRLLFHLYDLRHKNGGIVPVTEEIFSGGEPVSREAIAGVCREMADVGLIEWGPHQPPGHVIGSARLRGPGVDAVERGGSPSLQIRFPNKPAPAVFAPQEEPETESIHSAYTPAAARAVYEAIESLIAAGKRAYSLSVPLEAEKILVQSQRGRINSSEAHVQTGAAIIGLATEGKIEVYHHPREDWMIKEPLAELLTMAAPSQKIFIVHGHDGAPKAEVARFIEKLGLEAVILHERPNKGRTLITKFQEEAGTVEFAVVLMTPDDLGKAAAAAADLNARARQNVVFELGFFIGKLGPARVAALVKGDVEKPSDFDGVVYISLDSGDWQKQLGQELQAAGYGIDWNVVMGAA
jgi:predicted nucleotide-binding protein